ncbi:DUF3164 family protein [Porphyromonadaceae bacterium W3.11]|nr:DUF3164 family protein [Porphyromonadaceae bacterium W3.11]MDN4753419.1 DUF3164 family protein [Porphyromonadaceae bacterium W3.11]MDN4753642.1 DUF3164 family protein [Porphyromonadaceae bacterium W3.11]MDN4755014.1 DUF3164 family protein [Porphyromonadaceae bacterium W3.11]
MSTMTEQERKEFEEYKAWKKKKEEENTRQQNRDAYRELVDETLQAVVPSLQQVSDGLGMSKERVFQQFEELIRMKGDVLGLVSEGQRSHTFTNSDSTMRVTLGYHTIDGYRDTVDDGIQMVRKYLESLVGDDKSKALVDMVFRLLSKDSKGNLKASRVIQLRRIAEETKSEEFLEAVKIIEESYLPTLSKRYIRCEIKDDHNGWTTVPLSMTEVGEVSEM